MAPSGADHLNLTKKTFTSTYTQNLLIKGNKTSFFCITHPGLVTFIPLSLSEGPALVCDRFGWFVSLKM